MDRAFFFAKTRNKFRKLPITDRGVLRSEQRTLGSDHQGRAMQNIFQGGMRQVLGRYSDIVLAALVIGIIGMMIVPLPTFVLQRIFF